MTAVAEGRLLVVGAGTMGAQIALQSARHGIEVDLVDVSAEALARGVKQIDALLARDVDKGRRSATEAAEVRSRVVDTTDLESAGPGCDWVIEAVVERLDVKRTVFERLVEVMPVSAGLATNSSHMRAAEIAGDAPWRDRMLNMHFFHPVVVMDLVEIVASPHTREDVIRDAQAWAERMGRTSVLLRKDVEGFLVNRISSKAAREAFVMYADGQAAFDEIDSAVEDELGWPLGPFKLADLSGLDLRLQARSNHYAKYGEEEDRKIIDVVRPYVEAGRLGRKSGAGFYDYREGGPAPLPAPPTPATQDES